jgi:hypothetical protein
MPVSAVLKNHTDGSVSFVDGTGSPITAALKYSNGDFSVSGMRVGTQTTSRYQGRGLFRGSRLSEFEALAFTITCQMADFTAATGSVNPLDVMRKAGPFASAVSKYGANAQIMAYNLVFTVEGTNFGDSADHTLTLTNCEIETIDFSEGDPNSFTINGVCTGGWAST